MQSTRVAAVLCALSALPQISAQGPHRLRVVNGCEDGPMWIAHIAAGEVGPDKQDVKIEPLAYFDFETPDNLMATRFWPKMGCDAAGNNCALGDSGGPGESCVVRGPGYEDYSHCAPPVDTKFEASFGVNGKPCNPSAPGGSEMAGCDYIDISLVDGFTLPVKLDIHGECNESSARGSRVENIDCRNLTSEVCPRAEILADQEVVDLVALNPKTGQAAGCYSPCMRLLDTKWAHNDRYAEHPAVSPFCCPTPPVSPDECRAGPIATTTFVETVHSKCPGAYGYAYDDSVGLLRCTSATTYVLTYYCLNAPQEPAGNLLQFVQLPQDANQTDAALNRPGFLQKP